VFPIFFVLSSSGLDGFFSFQLGESFFNFGSDGGQEGFLFVSGGSGLSVFFLEGSTDGFSIFQQFGVSVSLGGGISNDSLLDHDAFVQFRDFLFKVGLLGFQVFNDSFKSQFFFFEGFLGGLFFFLSLFEFSD
jgi:hypothetical protein